MLTTNDIKNKLIEQYNNSNFVTDKSGVKTVEIIGANFIADKPFILREQNNEYIERELAWYKCQSLYVKDIPGNTPEIWNKIASSDGKINSNYGWCIFSDENHNQYDNVLNELKINRDSRRAAMIYNRPSMHIDYKLNGMNDFICTFSNQFFIRNDKLVSLYIMRSNDAIFGYNNDYAWAKWVQEKLANDLSIEPGDLIWSASSLHVYERHFNYLKI